GGLGLRVISPLFHLGGQAVQEFGQIAGFRERDRARNGGDEALEILALWGAGGRAVAEDNTRRTFGELGRQRNETNGEHRQRGFVALADDEQVIAALPMKNRFGRAFD